MLAFLAWGVLGLLLALGVIGWYEWLVGPMLEYPLILMTRRPRMFVLRFIYGSSMLAIWLVAFATYESRCSGASANRRHLGHTFDDAREQRLDSLEQMARKPYGKPPLLGSPGHYRLLWPNGRVYSVGFDGVDNGGKLFTGNLLPPGGFAVGVRLPSTGKRVFSPRAEEKHETPSDRFPRLFK